MSEGWHRADIRAAVIKKGKTLVQLSLDNGLPEWACRNAITVRHKAGEMAIARFLGVPLWELWPGRWRNPSKPGANAIRIDNRFRKKSRRSGPCRHRLNAEAA